MKMGTVYWRGPTKPGKNGKIVPDVSDGGSYWIQHYINGKVHAESAHSNVKAQAMALLKRRITQADAGTFVPLKDRRVTIGELVADLIQHYRTTANKARFAKDTQSRWDMHLKSSFEDVRADQLNSSRMRDYRAKRLEQETSQTTVNRELQVIRRAYKYAASQEPPKIRFIPRFEMASERDNPRKVFMSEEVKQRLKDAAAREGMWARVFVEMIFSLGWRKGEVVGLRVSNVHLAENFIRIETSKTGEPREVPLNESLRVLLEPLVIGKNPDEPLLPVTDVRYAWRRICKAAGVKAGREGYIPHDARRTAARTHRAAQTSETVASQIMGWQPGSKMFARYGIVDRADMAEALQRSEDYEKLQRKTTTKQLQLTQEPPVSH